MARLSNIDGQPDELFDSLATLRPETDHGNDEDQLSLFVLLSEDHEVVDGETTHLRHDISWLQFIDGLGVYIVYDVAKTAIGLSSDDPRGRVILVNKEGTVQHQWNVPSNPQDIDQIRQTVEQKIEEGEVN